MYYQEQDKWISGYEIQMRRDEEDNNIIITRGYIYKWSEYQCQLCFKIERFTCHFVDRDIGFMRCAQCKYDTCPSCIPIRKRDNSSSQAEEQKIITDENEMFIEDTMID